MPKTMLQCVCRIPVNLTKSFRKYSINFVYKSLILSKENIPQKPLLEGKKWIKTHREGINPSARMSDMQ